MPLTNVHFHLPALPEPSTRQVQQELLALPGVLEVIRERLNRLGSFFVQTSLEQLTS